MSSILVGRRRPAFTLIEVLVVVAIIALLIAILMPSLKQAKEQAKVAVCLSNLNSIGKAAIPYLNSNQDKFPWTWNTPATDAGCGGSMYSSYYGGNRSQGYIDDFGPDDKPLNKYMYRSKLGPDRRPNGVPGPLHVFECPSDDGARWDQSPGSSLTEILTCYQEIGTSYDENLNWWFFVQNETGQSPGSTGFGKRAWQIADRFVPIMRKHGASRAILIYEDAADFALATGLMGSGGFPTNFRVMGWHEKYDLFNMLFLDGHAAAVQADWRKVTPHPELRNFTGSTATWMSHHEIGDN